MGWGGCADKNLAKYSAIYHKRVSTAGVWTPSALGPLGAPLRGALSALAALISRLPWRLTTSQGPGRPGNGTRTGL